MDPILEIRHKVKLLAYKAFGSEKISQKPVFDRHSVWYKKKDEYLEAKAAFFQCRMCAKPYFGGEASKKRDIELHKKTKPQELICTSCNEKALGGGEFSCPKHGHFFIRWKCIFCCSFAQFKSGNTYLCKEHAFNDGNNVPRDCGGVRCPLGVPHPPASANPLKSMYPLGCKLCKNQEKKQKMREEKKAREAMEKDIKIKQWAEPPATVRIINL